MQNPPSLPSPVTLEQEHLLSAGTEVETVTAACFLIERDPEATVRGLIARLRRAGASVPSATELAQLPETGQRAAVLVRAIGSIEGWRHFTNTPHTCSAYAR